MAPRPCICEHAYHAGECEADGCACVEFEMRVTCAEDLEPEDPPAWGRADYLYQQWKDSQ